MKNPEDFESCTFCRTQATKLEGALSEAAELREKVAWLERRLYGLGWFPPVELRLTAHEGAILQALVEHERMAPNWLLYEATRAAPNGMGDDVDPSIVKVRMSGLRTKLRPHGLTIKTVWGLGYQMEPASRQRLLNWPTSQAA